MKHCPACAAPNPRTRATCYACRQSLDASPGNTAAPTRPPHAAPGCPNCGSRQVEAQRPDTCAGCGRLLNATTNVAALHPCLNANLPLGSAPDVFAPAPPMIGSGDAPTAGPPPGWDVEPMGNDTLRLRRRAGGGLFGRSDGGRKNKNGVTAGLLGARVLLDALAGLGGFLLMGSAAGDTGGVGLLEVGPFRLVVPRLGGGFGGDKPRVYTLGTTLTLELYDPTPQWGRRGGLLGGSGEGAAVRRLVAESVAGVTTLDETGPNFWGTPGDPSALNALAQFLAARTGFPLRDRSEASRRWL